jgi:hypothetical protein
MRLPAACLALALSCAVCAQAGAKSYWLLPTGEGQVWCGYSRVSDFTAEAARVKPDESARVRYAANRLVELTYQVEPQSADWVVIDSYELAAREPTLRRVNLLTQQNLKITEDAAIDAGTPGPFHIVSVTRLDGRSAQAPPDLDLPSVPVRADLGKMPFMAIVAEMRKRPAARLCRSIG